MTVVVTIATEFAIVAACDSAVKEEVEGGGVSYTTGRKSFPIPGTGIITTWGARDGNDVGSIISELPGKPSIGQVAERVYDYLQHRYNPQAGGRADVGYHIAGFANGQPRIYHAFWNAPTDDSLTNGRYSFQEIPAHPGFFALYNGRHDLAAAVFDSLALELRRGQRPRFAINNAPGIVALAHFILRFAGELSADVGPPFLAHVVSPDNQLTSTRLPDWQPILEEDNQRLISFLRRVETLHT